MLLSTRLSIFSTHHSAISCRLVPFCTFMPWVRNRHRPTMEIITSQEFTWASVISISISGMGMVRKTFAPVMVMPSLAGSVRI